MYKEHVGSGVPQGTGMGPLLFLMYINDLPDEVSSHVHLFADDCLLYRPIRSEDDQVNLQQDLDSLSCWAETWGMRFNPSKCHIMSVGTTKKFTKFYSLCGCILSQMSHSKYLGVTLSEDLQWNQHVSSLISHSQRKPDPWVPTQEPQGMSSCP